MVAAATQAAAAQLATQYKPLQSITTADAVIRTSYLSTSLSSSVTSSGAAATSSSSKQQSARGAAAANKIEGGGEEIQQPPEKRFKIFNVYKQTLLFVFRFNFHHHHYYSICLSSSKIM